VLLLDLILLLDFILSNVDRADLHMKLNLPFGREHYTPVPLKRTHPPAGLLEGLPKYAAPERSAFGELSAWMLCK